MRNSGTVGGKVNTPYKNLDFEGLTTNTTKVNVDNANRTISVDLLKEYAEQSDFNNLSGEVTNISGEVAVIAEEVAKKANIAEIDLNELITDEDYLAEFYKFICNPTKYSSNEFYFNTGINLDDYKDCQTVKLHFRALEGRDPEEPLCWEDADTRNAFEQRINEFIVSDVEILLPDIQDGVDSGDNSVLWWSYADTNEDGRVIELPSDWNNYDDFKYIYDCNCLCAWVDTADFGWRDYYGKLDDYIRGTLRNNGWSCYQISNTNKGVIWWEESDNRSWNTFACKKGKVTMFVDLSSGSPQNEFRVAIFDIGRNQPYYAEGSLYFNRDDGELSDGEEYPRFVYKDGANELCTVLNDNYLYCENISDHLDVSIDNKLSDKKKIELYNFLNNYPISIPNNIGNFVYCYTSQQINAWFRNGMNIDDRYKNINCWFNIPWAPWLYWECSPYDEKETWNFEEEHQRDDDEHLAYYEKYRNTQFPEVVKYEIYPDSRPYYQGGDIIQGENKYGTPDGFIKLANDGDYLQVNIELPYSAKGRLYLKAIMDNWQASENRDSAPMRSDGTPRMGVYVSNNDDYNDFGGVPEEHYGNKKYVEWLNEDSWNYDGVEYSEVGYIPWYDYIQLQEGQNSIEFHRYQTRSLLIESIVLVIEEDRPYDAELPDDFVANDEDNLWNHITFTQIANLDGYTTYAMVGVGETYDSEEFSPQTNGVRKNLYLSYGGICGTKEYNIPKAYPDLTETVVGQTPYGDDMWGPKDAGKFLRLSYNQLYDKLEYVHASAQEPIQDLQMIRMQAYDYMQNGASKSYVKDKISAIFNSANTWTGPNYYTTTMYTNSIMPSNYSGYTLGNSGANYHYGGAYINTLYGSDVTTATTANLHKKPVSEIVLSGELSTAISALSSVYAPITTVGELSSAFSAISSLQTSVASCVTSATLSTTLQSYATVAALDEYGATEVLSANIGAIFAGSSESGYIITGLDLGSDVYSMIYSLASLSAPKLVKQRLELLTADRPLLLDRFTVSSSAVYCDFNYAGPYGKMEGIARIYSSSGSNFCELDTTYGVYVPNINDWSL